MDQTTLDGGAALVRFLKSGISYLASELVCQLLCVCYGLDVLGRAHLVRFFKVGTDTLEEWMSVLVPLRAFGSNDCGPGHVEASRPYVLPKGARSWGLN